MDQVVDFVETSFEDFVTDFGECELLVERLEEFRLLLEGGREAGQRAGFDVRVNVNVGEVVNATILGARTLLSDCFGSTYVSIVTCEVVFDGNPLVAAVTFDTGGGTVFVLVLQPFSPTQLNDRTTIALDVGAMDALVRHEVLSFDHLAAIRVGTVQAPIRAVFACMLFDAASRN